ncbi:hypothetical protein [Steroidobacter denitrificans]|uniref:hypothetical protein n=1 Tax=Steroidobacter denitrificans TaxID=465721 RepID=UPI0012ED66F0|nr:hypothetical protein [Steroidobacter denitrificans]
MRAGNVLLLAGAMCLWMVVSAMHIHAGDAHDAGKPPAVCGVCLSLSAGAPPPARCANPAAVWTAGKLIAARIAPLPARYVHSFYLSRAPPAL